MHLFYTPDYDFYIFDLYVYGLDKTTGKERGFFIPYDEMVTILDNGGFSLYAKELFRGSLQDCLNFESRFTSNIPIKYYNLPPLSTPNICEGVVIKPVKEMYTSPKNDRFIIKKKNEEFNEMVKKPSKLRPRKSVPKPVFEDSSVSEPVFCAIMNYLNETRLESAISKTGDILNATSKKRNQCFALMVQDALADYKKEHLDEWEAVKKGDQKLITKHLAGEGKEIMYDYIYSHTGETIEQ